MPAAAGRTPEGGWWGGTARLSNVALPHFVRGTHETFSRAPCLSLGLGIKRDCVTWCVKAGECRTSAGDALFRRSWAGNWALLFQNAGPVVRQGFFLGRNGIATGNPRLRFPAIPFLPGSRSGLRANAQGHRGLRVLYSSQFSARCGTRGRHRRRVAFGGGGQGPALKIPCLSSWVVGWIPGLALRGSAGSYTAFGCRGGWGGARS